MTTTAAVFGWLVHDRTDTMTIHNVPPRINHPLFCFDGIHEDDIAYGMLGYRWLRSDFNRPGWSTALKNGPSRIVRRPVTVIAAHRTEHKSINVIEQWKQSDFKPAVDKPMPSNIFVDELLTPLVLLRRIDVRDEETGGCLEFWNHHPTRKNGVMVVDLTFTYRADNRDWRLRLGEHRDDRLEDVVPRDERGRITGPIDRDDIEE